MEFMDFKNMLLKGNFAGKKLKEREKERNFGTK